MKLFTLARLMIVIAIMGLAAQLQAAQVYLDVQAPYNDSNPQWKVWTWADGQNGYWVSSNEVVVLSNGLIEATVNEDNFQFVRCSSDGNTEWNRTVNLRTVADATYTITGWGSGSGMTVDVTNPAYNTVTLDLSKVSETDKVWYAWSFATGGNGSWVAGTQDGNEYTFNVASLKDKVIFVRMNANGAPSWNNGVKVNQTDDLTLQPDGTYVITNLESTNMTGYWKTSVWHQDPNGDPDYYLGNRKALVGRHCMANKLVNVVGVGSWINDLNNLVDEDLENWATFPKIADVGVGVNPVTSVRDTKNHYAAGTTAGFNVVLAADASLLGIDLANCFAISFFLEGELQQTVAVDGGQAFGGVGLSLITLPGSTDVSLDISATAPCEFDEIALMPAGVQVDVLSTARLRYAFVGDLITHTITETSMQNYAADHGRLPFTLDQGDKQHEGGSSIGVETGYWAGSDLINDDLTDGVVWGVIGIGSSMEARVGAAMNRQDPDQSQPFKAGSVVGFCYGNGSILNLPIGDAIRIRLYEGHWVEKTSAIYGTYYQYEQTEVQDESVKINVLSVQLIKGGNYQVTIKANHDFSHARISFPTGLTLNLGGNKVKYAFICDPPEKDHKCNLDVSANVALCADDTQYQLTADGGIPVTWSIVSQPSGANASIDQNGLLTGITVEDLDHPYIVRATAADGCYEDIEVTSGLNIETRCDMPISNGDEPIYALSEELPGADGALIVINDQLIAKENVLNANYNDYATYNSVINAAVIDNLPIVGVKKLNGNFSTGAKRRVGFVVETKSTGLSADALNIFNIRCYKNGVRTYWHAIDETNVVKAKVIGASKVQKLRYSIEVPADVEFDEFALWISGTLSLNLERFRIYYAFDEDAEGLDSPDDCGDPLGCAGHMVSHYENATLNSNEIQFAGAINAANVVDNLSFLVDDDINSAVTVTNTVSAGNGVVFAIDLGRVYSPKHQIGIVLDDKTYLAKAKVGNWLTIKTYLNGVATGDEQSDWSVIGVNAIGYGDKSYLYLTPTMPYDEVRITVAALVDALDFNTKYFGIFVRSDYDGDGTPDCLDDYTCPNPLEVDVRYESEFSAAEQLNIYKNTVKIYNNDGMPVMIEQLPVGSTIDTYRVDDNVKMSTITITGVTQEADGTYTINYTNTPGAGQDHADANRYPASTGTFTADEWGYIDFVGLFVVDQYSKSTATNSQPEYHQYQAVLENHQRNQTTASRVMDVPVIKLTHDVNAATFTQDEVAADTDHHLTVAPVDVYVRMENDAEVQKYEALRVAGSPAAVDTVAWAQRVDNLTFERKMKDNNGNVLNWGTVIFANEGDVQTVVLRDSTLQPTLGNYVPTIYSYTPTYINKKDTTVLSSYGADRITDELPSLNMTVSDFMVSTPWAAPYENYRSYFATIKLQGNVPDDMNRYYYRVWRVMPDNSEVLLNTLESQSGETWESDYDQLKDTLSVYDVITVKDVFPEKALQEGETLNVRYIARMYTQLKQLPSPSIRGNRDGSGSYGYAPSSGSGSWDPGTPTSLDEMNSALVPLKTTYYNAQGMSSSTPFDGLNIIVIQYTNGKTMVLKHMY